MRFGEASPVVIARFGGQARHGPSRRVAAAIRVRYHEKSPRHGPVAQMGARVNGIHEVTGSIPVWSTILRFAQAG